MDVPPQAYFVAILLLVPAQYLLSPSQTSDIKYQLNRFAERLSNAGKYATSLLWSRSAPDGANQRDDVAEESVPAIEDTPHYGLGRYLRERAPHVKFRVGDVIKHKQGFRAIIIGWDLKAQAPKEFIAKVHRGKTEWTDGPNYAVLIDVRDRMTPQLAYVVEQNIEQSTGQIMHPLLRNYIERYDEKREKYQVKPWLKSFYPDD